MVEGRRKENTWEIISSTNSLVGFQTMRKKKPPTKTKRTRLETILDQNVEPKMIDVRSAVFRKKPQ